MNYIVNYVCSLMLVNGVIALEPIQTDEVSNTWLLKYLDLSAFHGCFSN